MEPDAVEIRVLGCLIEKQRTTPDVYPLTLNSLRLACNQSTNRDPVVDYDDGIIRGALDRLVQRKWATLASWANRRAMKYRHTLDRAIELDDGEISLLCVLMLRGPQTPGELRARSERLHRFADGEELDGTLERLMGREFVERLGRRPGQREERFRQLLGGGVETDVEAAPAPPEAPVVAAPPEVAPAPADELAERVERLERELAELREGLSALRRELGA
jgi:uncharacterized protein YceH (UPF0502 family)